jgi:hypothetical protein
MTKYLDEYNPKAAGVNFRVQSDDRKLKFNNIQSCMAVVLLPVGGHTMVGVHITTATSKSAEELTTVVKELRAAVGPGPCDAYLVANYTTFHARTGLGKALKKLARKVYVCDLPPSSDTVNAADADVKVELSGGVMAAYVRRHAVFVTDASNRRIKKPNAVPGAVPGKPSYLTDRDDKPWMPVPFQPLP